MRLTDAIAGGGGHVQALVSAVQGREARRRELLAQLDAQRAVEPLDPKAVRGDLEARLGEWRSLLQDRAAHGRRLLKQLIVGRLDLTPNLEDRYYDFRGTGTLVPVIAGVVPQSVASLSTPSWNQIVTFLESMRQLRNFSGFAA